MKMSKSEVEVLYLSDRPSIHPSKDILPEVHCFLNGTLDLCLALIPGQCQQ